MYVCVCDVVCVCVCVLCHVFDARVNGSADDKSECVGDNECVMFPCQGAMDCKNTPGSYSCVCTSPNLMVSDVVCEVRCV